MERICIVPRVDGTGGMASFRSKFEQGLRSHGVEVTYDLSTTASAILVLAGTRHLFPLWKARQRGRRIVQRLDGINWVHKKRNTGIRHYLRAEYGNFILSFIRSYLATKVVYQSEFTCDWWETWYGKTRVPATMIHNGVDLNLYSVGHPANATYKILLVEGSLGGGYEMGLDNALELAGMLKEKYAFPIELVVVGKMTEEHRSRAQSNARIPLQFLGSVPHEQIPEVYRSAHLFFSADLHPACPNSVIESLASGLPVVAFDTGSLKELVTGDAGRIVPYGSDPWQIEKPDIPALAEAAVEVLKNRAHFSQAARARAESALGLDKMMDAYLKFLLED